MTMTTSQPSAVRADESLGGTSVAPRASTRRGRHFGSVHDDEQVR